MTGRVEAGRSVNGNHPRLEAGGMNGREFDDVWNANGREPDADMLRRSIDQVEALLRRLEDEPKPVAEPVAAEVAAATATLSDRTDDRAEALRCLLSAHDDGYRLRAEAARLRSDAAAEGRQLLTEAQERAERVRAEARAAADEIRTSTLRALAEARAQTESAARAALAEAGAAADRARAAARSDAEQVTAEADNRIAERRETAAVLARQCLDEAERDARKVLEEARKRVRVGEPKDTRRAVKEGVAELKADTKRLGAATRDTLVVALNELEQVTARLAALAGTARSSRSAILSVGAALTDLLGPDAPEPEPPADEDEPSAEPVEAVVADVEETEHPARWLELR